MSETKTKRQNVEQKMSAFKKFSLSLMNEIGRERKSETKTERQKKENKRLACKK